MTEPNQTADTKAPHRCDRDAPMLRQVSTSPAAGGRRVWRACLVTAVAAALVGLSGPVVVRWISPVDRSRPGIPGNRPIAASGEAAGMAESNAGSGSGAPLSPTASPHAASAPAKDSLPALPGLPPSEPLAAARGSLPQPDAPLPSTQDEVFREMDGITEYIVASFPGQSDALEIKARYQNWRGNSAEAVRLWERCIELNPRYGYAYYGIGTVAAGRGERLKAVEQFRKALSSKPEWPEAQLELARALVNAAQFEEAVSVLETHLKRRTIIAEAYVILGQALSHGKELAKAKESYARAIAIGAGSSDAYYGLALACMRLGETEQAQRHMDKFRLLRTEEVNLRKREKARYDDLDAVKGDIARICTNAVPLFLAHGKAAEAEQLCRRVAALDRTQLECRQALAWFCRRSGRTAEAIGLLKELARIESNDPTYLIEAGRLETGLRQYDAAEATLRAACKRAAKDADAPAALAQMYLAAGRNLAEARGLAEKAVRLEPTGPHYLVLAAVCEKQNDHAGAHAARHRATELKRNSPGKLRAGQEIPNPKPPIPNKSE